MILKNTAVNYMQGDPPQCKCEKLSHVASPQH